jgi:hypothetical protein
VTPSLLRGHARHGGGSYRTVPSAREEATGRGGLQMHDERIGPYVLDFQEIDAFRSRRRQRRAPGSFRGSKACSCRLASASRRKLQRIMAEATAMGDRLSRLKPDDREAIRALMAHFSAFPDKPCRGRRGPPGRPEAVQRPLRPGQSPSRSSSARLFAIARESSYGGPRVRSNFERERNPHVVRRAEGLRRASVISVAAMCVAHLDSTQLTKTGERRATMYDAGRRSFGGQF